MIYRERWYYDIMVCDIESDDIMYMVYIQTCGYNIMAAMGYRE